MREPAMRALQPAGPRMWDRVDGWRLAVQRTGCKGVSHPGCPSLPSSSRSRRSASRLSPPSPVWIAQIFRSTCGQQPITGDARASELPSEAQT
jgi:hypothetical protein